MNTIAIIADSTCDLNEALQEQYRIVIVPAHVVLPNQEEVLSTFRWDAFGSRETFYADLKRAPDSFKTSPPNVVEFQQAIEQQVKLGHDVIVMTISGGISGAIDFATAARNNVLETYPEAKVTCIDSRRFGPGFGLMVLYACRLRDAGIGYEELVDRIEQNKSRFHQAGWLDDLSFVAKRGRLTHAKAFLGSLAGVKPIGEFDQNGLTTVIGKIKGAKNAYAALLDYIAHTIEEPEEQTVIIAQTNRLPQAEAYRDMIAERFHPKEIFIHDVFPPCGINVGPGLMAAYYIGKPISDDLSEEKAILNQFSGGESK